MLGDEPMNSGRSVVGGYMYGAYAFEFIKLEQIGAAARSKQKLRSVADAGKSMAEIKQWSHANTAANE